MEQLIFSGAFVALIVIGSWGRNKKRAIKGSITKPQQFSSGGPENSGLRRGELRPSSKGDDRVKLL